VAPKEDEGRQDAQARAAEAVDLLRKVIALERKVNCADEAVDRGLEALARNWLKRVKEQGLQRLLAGLVQKVASDLTRYGRLSLTDRRRLLQELEAKLDHPAEKEPLQARGEGLDTPVQFVKGVGPRRAEALKRAEITTVRDLLYYLPRRHEDRTKLLPIWQLRSGDRACVRVTVCEPGFLEPHQRVTLVKVPAIDDTGALYLVWFNQPYMLERFKEGQEVLATGTVRRYRSTIDLHVEDYELLQEEQDPLQVGRIVPIYPLTQGVSQLLLRRAVDSALKSFLDQVEDAVPAEVRARHGLMSAREALPQVHFPGDLAVVARARDTLAFEELLALQVAFRLGRNARETEEQSPSVPDAERHMRAFAALLPFHLTASQEQALHEIARDLSAGRPMNRLLHGEVGSGKTVLAAAAAYAAAQAGFGTVLMAPTEVLATQHYRVLADLLGRAGVPVRLLIGSLPAAEKRRARAWLHQPQPQVAVGTHALIEEQVVFAHLGLSVIDEQQRFGVAQRLALRSKGANCHVLVMSATPIPRTLMLTAYGDLEVSTLRELPPGRQPVETRISTRAEAYAFLREEIGNGGQAYVVCPLIGEEGDSELTAVMETADRLSQTHLGGARLAILHGRMSREEQDAVVSDFRDRRVDVLVCTTVIEVGVDVPNATVMVIEDAERFGLAQLHQLRGRVGRGEQRSYCFLLPGSRKAELRQRLRIVAATNDGFRVAEEDLRLRGPGEFYGLRQHGVPDLRVADVLRDADLLVAARDEATAILAADPALQRPEHRELRRLVGLYSARQPVAEGAD
jgi:ATP-dependent DNA helicase RecG